MMRGSQILGAMALVIGLVGSGRANEFGSLEQWGDGAAKLIAEVAAMNNASKVFVEEIKSPPEQEGGGGTRLMTVLDAALKATKLTVSKQDYQLLVKGRTKLVRDGETKKAAIDVTMTFENREGDQVLRRVLSVQGEAAVPLLAALNKNLPPKASPKEIEDKILDPKPDVSLEGSKIKTVPTSPYAVEILVKENGKYVPRKATKGSPASTGADKTERPFVDVKGEEVFAIRLHNDSPHEAAVHVTVDGLSVFEFSEIKEKPLYWIVPAKSTLDVLGWKITEQDTDEFKSIEFPKSAVASKGLSHDARVGVVTALFSAAWENEADQPKDEGQGSKSAGRGDRIKDTATVVQRFIGKIRDSISVRYERELPGA
jgi:hypothetical protein